jgi:hypothetical protein
MNKPRVAAVLTSTGMLLWLGPLILLIGSAVPSLRSLARHTALDLIVFAAAWAFIFGVPIVAIGGWRLSERGTKTRTLAKLQLLMWAVLFALSLLLVQCQGRNGPPVE